MSEMPSEAVQTLTLLAKLFDSQAAAAAEGHADFYQGAAHGCRVALQIVAPPPERPQAKRSKNGWVKHSPAAPPAPAVPAAVAVPAPPAPTKAASASRPKAKAKASSNGSKGGACPECGKTYALVQHLGMHRKRAHGVPSEKDLIRLQRIARGKVPAS